MEKYTDLFIDFDDTLYDTHGNAVIALEEIFEYFNLGQYFKSLEDFTVPYWKTNVELWEQYAHGIIERSYLMLERFRRPLAEGFVHDGVHFDPTPEYCMHISDVFLDHCACKSGVVEGAHEVMEYLKKKGYHMHMCSNGFKEVQYRKLKASNLFDYFDNIVLSDAAGVNKPAPGYFEYAFKMTGVDPKKTLMIGDNFDTDIMGAKRMGLDVMFFNRHPEKFTATEPIEFEIRTLKEILNIL